MNTAAHNELKADAKENFRQNIIKTIYEIDDVKLLCKLDILTKSALEGMKK